MVLFFDHEAFRSCQFLKKSNYEANVSALLFTPLIPFASLLRDHNPSVNKIKSLMQLILHMEAKVEGLSNAKSAPTEVNGKTPSRIRLLTISAEIKHE